MSESFYLNLPKLGPEYTVAALVAEFYERHLESNRRDILKTLSDAQIDDLNNFTEKVYSYIIENKNDAYDEYVRAIVTALEGDANNEEDIDRGNFVMIKALRDNHLIKWYKMLK